MNKIKKYSRRTKVFINSAEKEVKKAGKSKYAKSKKLWTLIIIAILAAIFWALPAYAAKAPGQLGYNVKRLEESITTTLAPTTGLRDSLKLDFAQRRVNEATYVAIHANDTG